MKTCRGCGIIKPLSDYHNHPGARDGHINKCKQCVREAKNLRLTIRHIDPNWSDRFRAEARVRTKKHRLDNRNTERWKTSRSQYAKEYGAANKYKCRARRAVLAAIKKGTLEKQPCRICGNPQSQAHHPDYSRPLDIVWLCPLHHGEAHFNENQARRLAEIIGTAR